SLGVIGGYAIEMTGFGVTSGFFGVFLAIAMIVHGIYYIKTKCAYKNKDFEWAWFWVYGILAFIIFGSEAYKYFADLGGIWWLIVAALWILGYRWGADQSDLIKSSKKAKTIQKVQVVNNKLDKADKIAKYKKLLDENAISKAEYNELKAEILEGKSEK
ncbi:SHOCT domain-containing protein, partial [Lactobacillus intestinalis]